MAELALNPAVSDPSPHAAHHRRHAWRGVAISLPIALLTLIPLLVVLASFLSPQPEIWAHLAQYVLPGVLRNTLLLIIGVGLGVLGLGVSLAWLTAMCEFPGRRFFAWALMLPLAMPAYVLAFVMVGLLDFTGPVQTWLRAAFGGSAWFPPIRSSGGVVLVLSLAFYPYVYLLARNAFATQGRRALEAAQMLGVSRRAAFWRVAIPMARPWIVGGLTLALMETLADFGAVSVFNFDTFTTAIYKAWFALFNLPAASQLASLLVLFVLALAVVEQRVRGERLYHARAGGGERIALRGTARWGAVAWCALVLLVAFVVPLIQLGHWVTQVWADDFDERYPAFIGRSVLLAALETLLVAALALALAYARRRYRDGGTRWLVRLATLGYAVPGTVLAVGVFIPIAWLDNLLLAIFQPLGFEGFQVFKGTVAVMLLALAARFLAVGFQPVDSGMQRITRNQEEAARSLGLRSRQVLLRLHLPLLRGGLFTALLMVFVDVMKEMPITLMTRAFGWDTLAVRVFEMTSEGMWDRAALPALFIVLAGLLPVLLLTRHGAED
ncbi:iron ABC transporter permease [Chitiniphilus shinanonensis]|uniref:Iron ABC transporter permease n=1 Tax=Chitiniphilus shinanonensis TaxID=553088 RepID=A0ABQ6BY41_9NEIS|nr:iron ABC transporter permease [Chitiniphilus shinanonensis]GLS06302.1 iron ABC transporter permease [Chitiniphilus shinanonensis]